MLPPIPIEIEVLLVEEALKEARSKKEEGNLRYRGASASD